MHPASEVPQWIQVALTSAAALAVFVATLFGYIRKGKASSAGSDLAVVTASFADRKEVEKLADAFHRLERTIDDAAQETRRARQAIEENTDAQINLLHFLKSKRSD